MYNYNFDNPPWYEHRNSIKSINIGFLVTDIGSCAFKDCSRLTSVSIPNGVTYIGYHAFKDCSSLASISIPNGVTEIGYSTFYGCSGLTTISIPNSVTSIGESAFYGCSGLTSISIPNSVTSIGVCAFYGCSGLTSISLPRGIYRVSIGNSAFSNCSSLTSVTIPSNVTSIGNSAFSGCSGLTSVTIPSEVIGNSAFANCSGLTNITIGSSVSSIGSNAFTGCIGLTSIEWNAIDCSDFSSFSSNPFYQIRTQITSFVFGDHVKVIPWYLCYGMTNLSSVTIPNSVNVIEPSAFEGCGLSSIIIVLPYSVDIQYHAFYLTNATSVVLGNGVSIGNEAFYSESLDSVIINSSTPPTCGNNAFGSYSTGVKIFVPCGSLNRYNSAAVWKEYSIQHFSTNINAVSSDENRGIVSYPQNICETPQISATPNEGYHFTQWDDGNTDNPRTIDINEEKTYTASFDINMYQVQFFGFNDTLLSKQSVAHGTAAMAPKVPSVDNYEFIGWDKNFSNVKMNMDVFAQYVEKPNGTENIPFENNSFKKVLINHQLYILLPDGTRYDATGKKVE